LHLELDFMIDWGHRMGFARIDILTPRPPGAEPAAAY